MNRVKQFIKRPEFLILSLLLIFRVIYFFCLDYHFTPDSKEYISRDGFAWLHGSVDKYRLPVYPMLIDICQYLSDTQFVSLVCVVQLIASLSSIIILYLTIKKITDKKWICIITTAVYAMLNATIGWDKTILTESLSLSLTVYTVFGIISFIKDSKYRYVLMTTACLLVGCFLRAIFVIYAGLFFGFLVLISIWPGKDRPRMRNIRCTAIATIPVLLVLVYAFMFHRQYGGFTVSDSALGQQVYIVLENHYYEDSSDAEIKGLVETIFSSSEEKLDNYSWGTENPTYMARLCIMEGFDRDRVKAFVDEAIEKNLKSYLIDVPGHFFDGYFSYNKVKETRIAELISGTMSCSFFFLSITVLHSFIISITELISYGVIFRKKKRSDWIRLGLGIYILATVLLSVFGTNSEFARAAITSLPFMFVAFSIYADWFFKQIAKHLPKQTEEEEAP